MVSVDAQSPTKSTPSRTLSRGASTFNPTHASRKVKINVGGQVHEPFASTLKNIPDSPLACILDENSKNMLDYDKDTRELFFDRHPETFSQVLDYFQTGKLHYPRSVCGPMFEEELKFWGIEEQQMETCCWSDYTHHRVTQENLKIFQPSLDNKDTTEAVDVELGQVNNHHHDIKHLSQWSSLRYRVWKMVDQPSSSSAAKLYAWTSLCFIVLSIITFTIYTIEHKDSEANNCNNASSNKTAINSTSKRNGTNATVNHNRNDEQDTTDLWMLFRPIEAICIVWFTIEFSLRVMFCPKKFQFFCSLSTLLDIVALVTAYLLIFTEHHEYKVIGIVNMARFFRISRFFKIFYSLQIMGLTLKASAYHFLTLLFLLIIPVILFSSFIFYTEDHWGTAKSKKNLGSIPLSFWWAIITMTTVGYGDAVPESNPGLFVGGLAAVMGVIILSLTSSILGSTFEQYYNLGQTQLKIPRQKNNKVHVHFESLNEMAGIASQEVSKSSIKSGNTFYSGRDSGYGNSPVSKQRGRSISHPPDRAHRNAHQKRRSLKVDFS